MIDPRARIRLLSVLMLALAICPVVRSDDDDLKVRKGKFVRVADASTIVVMRFNREYFFVLLGVRPVIGLDRSGPLEKEAKDYLASLLQDQRVILELDKEAPVDDSVRTYTGYAYLEDGTCVNEEILKRGYGSVDDRDLFSRLDEFRALEGEAREEGQGLWGRRKALDQAPAIPCGESRIAYAGTCGVTNPELIRESQVKPEYPGKARRKKIEGRVVLSAVVSKDGSVADVVELKSPDARLTEAAIEAVKQWRYKPALKDGEPVDAHFTVVVDFYLARNRW